MSTLRSILACLALLALTAFLGTATACAWLTARLIRDLPCRIDTAITETRAQLLGQLADTEAHLLQRIDTLGARADSRIGRLEVDARAELAATRELVDRRLGDTLGRTDVALADVHGLREDARPILDHLRGVTKQVDDSLPLFLDCENNPSCMYNRFQGTSKAIEKAAQNVGAMSTEAKAALPSALKTWQSIGGNVDQTSANVARITKPHWYDNLIKGLAVGATVGAVVK